MNNFWRCSSNNNENPLNNIVSDCNTSNIANLNNSNSTINDTSITNFVPSNFSNQNSTNDGRTLNSNNVQNTNYPNNYCNNYNTQSLARINACTKENLLDFLCNYLGKKCTCEFITNNSVETKSGILERIGNNFFGLRAINNNRIIYCNISNLIFVTIAP